jgi:hypothetical protein
VFFSCFFLFLAVCVLIWKSKQAVDVHRTRHRQRMQMEHMASRPFGRVLALLDPSMTPLVAMSEDAEEMDEAIGGGDDGGDVIAESSTDDKADKADTSELKTPEDRPISPTIIITKVRSSTRSTSSRRFKEGATSPTSMSSISVSSACAPPPQFHVAPIALEPMDDGIASIGTVLMQLPGGSAAPMQMALGSALISLRVHYLGHGGGGGGAGACRGDAMRDSSKQVLHHRHTTSTA